jgi:hypothetical protein
MKRVFLLKYLRFDLQNFAQFKKRKNNEIDFETNNCFLTPSDYTN